MARPIKTKNKTFMILKRISLISIQTGHVTAFKITERETICTTCFVPDLTTVQKERKDDL